MAPLKSENPSKSFQATLITGNTSNSINTAHFLSIYSTADFSITVMLSNNLHLFDTDERLLEIALGVELGVNCGAWILVSRNIGIV